MSQKSATPSPPKPSAGKSVRAICRPAQKHSAYKDKFHLILGYMGGGESIAGLCLLREAIAERRYFKRHLQNAASLKI